MTEPNDDLLTEAQLDTYVPALIKQYVPCSDPDERFKVIAQDFGGVGTTCGFLGHFVMYAIGYRGPLLNRTNPASGHKYKVGQNISMIWNLARKPFIPFKTGMRPRMGDIVYVSNGHPMTEHVFIYLDSETVLVNGQKKVYWLSADGGQNDEKTGKQAMRFRKRLIEGRVAKSASSERGIQGWLPLRALARTVNPFPIDTDTVFVDDPNIYGLDGVDGGEGDGINQS